jgi:transcriptional regulator with XRE-family HTH domain
MNHSIGEQIAKRRKDLSMTQEAVANLTEISENQISNLENNHCVPTVETILKLCKALKVTPDYFLLGTEHEKGSENKIVADITEKSLLCTEKQQKLIREFVLLLAKEDY